MIIPILMYHSIGSDNNPFSVSKINFEKQIKLMKFMNYQTISFDNLHNNINYKNKFIITFDDGYEDVYKNALPILKKYDFKATCYFVTNLIGKHNIWDENHINYTKLNLMNLHQIKDWINSEMDIGAHTLNHFNLSNISPQKQKNEILGPKIFFENNLSIKVNTFSYPYGKYDINSINIVKENYKFAVTTKRSRFISDKFDYHLLPRIPMNNKVNLIKLFLKIKTPYEDIKYTSNAN